MTESDHPYNQFLAGQKQRESAWKTNRETKRAKVQSTTSMMYIFFVYIFHQLHTTANSEIVNESLVSHETELPVSQDLTTINLDALSRLHEEEPPEICSPVLQAATTTPVGELISTCVTPSRIKMVQKTLVEESQRHLCALKLLPCFLSKDELATSNTDGSHNKKCLDGNKLNSLKILVFSKFPASNSEEKDKAWRFTKSKINTKCRVKRKLAKENILQPSL